MKTTVEAKLVEQRRAREAERLEAALGDELLKRHPFEVPPRLLAHQTERLTRDFSARRLLTGVPEEQVQGEVATFAKQLREQAERLVKLSFIFDRIATQESVTVTEEDVVERLWQMAKRAGKDPAEVRKVFDAKRLWPSVIATVRQDKTVALLIARSHAGPKGPALRAALPVATA